MPTQISYSRGAREVKVEEVVLKLRSDLSQKRSNSLQISRPREINIQGGVLTVEDWQEKFRYVKSGYGHGHGQGENPTQQIDKDPDENPTQQIDKDPEINIEAGGSGKSTDDPPARSWEDESDDDMLRSIYEVPFVDEFDGPLARCELCGQTVSHYAASCPYLIHLPHHVTLPLMTELVSAVVPRMATLVGSGRDLLSASIVLIVIGEVTTGMVTQNVPRKSNVFHNLSTKLWGPVVFFF